MPDAQINGRPDVCPACERREPSVETLLPDSMQGHLAALAEGMRRDPDAMERRAIELDARGKAKRAARLRDRADAARARQA